MKAMIAAIVNVIDQICALIEGHSPYTDRLKELHLTKLGLGDQEV